MREHVAILRLSARTHGEHDAEARAFESRFVPMIFFDQGQARGQCRRWYLSMSRGGPLASRYGIALLFDYFKKHSSN
jgi:hypothetical protein